MDSRAQQAREHHRRAGESNDQAARHRAERDRLIRELRADHWNYAHIAREVGCSEPLVAKILRGPQ